MPAIGRMQTCLLTTQSGHGLTYIIIAFSTSIHDVIYYLQL